MRDAGRELARVPAIALTAYASRDDRLRMLTAGFQAHLAKPIDPLELVTNVANVAKLLH
jgi:CheY-like chemotaxis protein